MSQAIITTLTVVGVGLIGGSFSRALKAAGAVERVIGVDQDAENLALALRLGVIDEAPRHWRKGSVRPRWCLWPCRWAR